MANRGTFFKCFDITTMGKSKDDVAKDMLTRAAALVQPLMESRRWTVGGVVSGRELPIALNCHPPLTAQVHKLVEFFPPNPNLLGLNYNHGQKVCVRLRPARSENSFLPFESVVGTLLHELSHIVHGPHREPFYKLLAEITEECERLQVKAIPFAGAGKALPGRAVDRAAAGTAAAKAAERRSFSGAPRRLGGQVLAKLSPAEAAARAALQRRLDAVQCGTLGAEDADVVPAPAPATAAQAAQKFSAATASKLAPVAANSGKRMAQNWTCQSCTFVNEKPLAAVCGICATERDYAAEDDLVVVDDDDPPLVQDADQAGATVWICQTCTYEHTDKPHALLCSVCFTPRSKNTNL